MQQGDRGDCHRGEETTTSHKQKFAVVASSLRERLAPLQDALASVCTSLQEVVDSDPIVPQLLLGVTTTNMVLDGSLMGALNCGQSTDKMSSHTILMQPLMDLKVEEIARNAKLVAVMETKFVEAVKAGDMDSIYNINARFRRLLHQLCQGGLSLFLGAGPMFAKHVEDCMAGYGMCGAAILRLVDRTNKLVGEYQFSPGVTHIERRALETAGELLLDLGSLSLPKHLEAWVKQSWLANKGMRDRCPWITDLKSMMQDPVPAAKLEPLLRTMGTEDFVALGRGVLGGDEMMRAQACASLGQPFHRIAEEPLRECMPEGVAYAAKAGVDLMTVGLLDQLEKIACEAISFYTEVKGLTHQHYEARGAVKEVVEEIVSLLFLVHHNTSQLKLGSDLALGRIMAHGGEIKGMLHLSEQTALTIEGATRVSRPEGDKLNPIVQWDLSTSSYSHAVYDQSQRLQLWGGRDLLAMQVEEIKVLLRSPEELKKLREALIRELVRIATEEDSHAAMLLLGSSRTLLAR